jgi:hypothetical protein
LSEILFSSTELSWGIGYCTMCMRGALWRVVVDFKYSSSWGGWCSNVVHGSYGVGLCKYIRRDWWEFSIHTRFKLGDGSKIRFWHNVWCSNRPLKATFHVLFSITRCKDASVTDHLEFSSDSHQLNVHFIRAAHD